MPTVSGSKLNSAHPNDIEFLSSFFTDLCAVLAGKGTSNLECRGLYTMEWLLSDILSPGNAQQEPHTSQQQELDSDLEDETWVEEWDVQELLVWMLLEARAAALPEQSHHLVKRLERRLTSTRTHLSRAHRMSHLPNSWRKRVSEED
ncbi:hypothetical protein M407DRAFT_195827 [Tulasnella calospora MUT 4182]|uniref:Uncharacterized protein n=1 Tax=Tulasnella calospora MUT 4182 TaxID=1051891 RepID=A0A0C3LZX7_9AGAM|nr:hypothetical protein M407DRAFT_195827 [Tulasnella calospora MUT 4182]